MDLSQYGGVAYPGHTPEGTAFTEIVLEVFRLNGALIAAANELTRELDLTSSRWQVLGAIVIQARPLTVSQIARSMGLTRQSVQRTVNRLEQEGLAERVTNPDHRRAPLVQLTEHGQQAFVAVSARQVPWANHCAGSLTADELKMALHVLRTLRERVENPMPVPRS